MNLEWHIETFQIKQNKLNLNELCRFSTSLHNPPV